jgi:hypothetical protein
VRTKCAEKASVDLWSRSRGPRELSEVTGPNHPWSGCYILRERERELSPAPKVFSNYPHMLVSGTSTILVEGRSAITRSPFLMIIDERYF